MKAEHIKVVAFDVDGVFTDGTLYYGANGDCMKAFSARDGMGISMVKAAGLRTAIITGRSSQSVAKRAENLGITYVIQGSSYKKEGLAELCEKAQVTEKEVAYMGDDINDLPVIAAVGFSGAPQDASRQVREAVLWVSDNPGGHGAVREFCEYILEARKQLDDVIAAYKGGKNELKQ